MSDIRDYLDYAENQSKENGYEMNGIRIYNGAYPTTKEDVGYSTSFIVPTTIGVNGNERSGGNKDIPRNIFITSTSFISIYTYCSWHNKRG